MNKALELLTLLGEVGMTPAEKVMVKKISDGVGSRPDYVDVTKKDVKLKWRDGFSAVWGKLGDAAQTEWDDAEGDSAFLNVLVKEPKFKKAWDIITKKFPEVHFSLYNAPRGPVALIARFSHI